METADLNFCAVRNFRALSPEGLTALGEELSLCLTVSELERTRRAFLEKILRDPLVAELKFLSAWAAHTARLADRVQLTALSFEDDGSARIWRDICRQREALGDQNAPMLSSLSSVCGRYLARSGILPASHAVAVPTVEAAAYEDNNAFRYGDLCLSTATPAERRSDTTALIALSPTGREPFAAEVAAFCARHRDLSLVPFATPGAEGLLPHLFSLPGIMLDAAQLPGYDENDLASLCHVANDTALFLAPQWSVTRLFDGETPLSLCGTVQFGSMLTVRDGLRQLLSLPFPLLSAWRAPRAVTLHIPAEPASDTPPVTVCRREDTVVGAVSATGHTMTAVTSLFAKALTYGADPAAITLSTVLELPLDANVAEVLPLLLGFHRAAAELVLPATRHRMVCTSSDMLPRLSVFLTAPAKKTPDESEKEMLFAAAERLDFAALRALAENF